MPWPSSTTSIRPWPAASIRTSIRDAPASIAFSASSLTTAAGRSTTSPAAIPSSPADGRIAMVWPGASPTSGRGMLSLPGEEFFQRLTRREALEVQLLQLGDNRMIQRQAELRARLRPFERPLAFQLGQHLPGAHDNLTRHAGELRDVDSITPIGPTLNHLVEKDDAFAFFAHLHPKIAQPGKLLAERGQLVIVGGEECQRAKLWGLVQILEDRLRDAHAVVGAGAASDLVEDG